MMEKKGQILRIERISNFDGNGLRTVIYFKGCQLRCEWCSTPESHSIKNQLYYRYETCILCGRCIKTCPECALSFSENNKRIEIDTLKCKKHFECVKICPTNSLGVYGKEMTVEEVIKEIRKDEVFYFHSGGGVTLSGGDILIQAEFARELLIACKDTFINTSAELDMYGNYDNIQLILPYLDTVYADVKVMDSSLHKKWTGVDNYQILENIKKASKDCKKDSLHVRVPLIWGINDDKENLLKTAEFCKKLNNCVELEFLPYHRLGIDTYKNLNRLYKLRSLPTMSYQETLEKITFLLEYNWPFSIKIAGNKILNSNK